MKIKWEYTNEKKAVMINLQLLYSLAVEVWGDRNNGCYEWIIRGDDGEAIAFSNDGYGQSGLAMLEGLQRVNKWINNEIEKIHP